MSLAKAFPLQYNPVIDESDEETEDEETEDEETEDEETEDEETEGEESEESEESEKAVDVQMNALDLWKQVAIESFSNKYPELPESPQEAHESPEAYRIRTTVVMLDSLDRNLAVYPLPTQVSFNLPRLFKNVERIDILQVKFLCGLYNISPTLRNNTFTLVDSTPSTYTLTIPPGFYGVQQLTATLQGLLNGVGSTSTFAVTWSPTTGRITIAATDPFSISLFRTPISSNPAKVEWGLGWHLGWNGPPATLTGAASYTAPSFPRVDKDYVFLRMNDSERMNEVVTLDQVDHYFGKLLLNDFGAYAQSFVEAPKIYELPVGRLERLQFAWTDRHGSPLVGADAATCDWHMTLRITERVFEKDAT